MRSIGKFITAAALLSSLVVPVCAQPITVHIRDDMGGVLGVYITKYQTIEAAGERVELSGDCVSACTLVLMLPKWEACAMPHTRLGFHASRDTIASTKPNVTASIWFFKHYPQKVRDWILSLPITLRIRYRSAASLGIAPCKPSQIMAAN